MPTKKSDDICLNMMISPSRSIVVTADTLQSIGSFTVPADFVCTMYEVESDGNLQFSMHGDMQVASGKTSTRTGGKLLLNRYAGQQYAGRIKKIYAELSTTGVVLYGCYMRNDGVDKTDRDAT